MSSLGRDLPQGTKGHVVERSSAGRNLTDRPRPEVGTASQGRTVEEAVENLKEATELYLEEFISQV